MNNLNITAFWHKTSYDRFMQERLPQLLAERLPLSGYQCLSTGRYTCQVTVAITAGGQEIEVTYTNLPQPDGEGVYLIDGGLHTIVPQVLGEELTSSEIQCGGELLFDFVAARVGIAPADLPWTESLLRTWLPLDRWLFEFMQNHPAAQWLDTTNWLARQTHLRRLIGVDHQRFALAGQPGRVCPFEMPEGPNLGRILSITLGAAIRDGKLVVVDQAPAAALGLSASMIPCLEHNDPNRLLMGANMLRQWLPYAEPEPALVQSGNEPAAPDFWCGRNLLTAFIPWGGDTVEDGIILSASGAQRLSNVDHQVEPGDKLSNRHGSKGVVSRILPDAQMPHLADGTPVDLIFSGMRLPGRQNFGQLWEAVLGRLAQTEGMPIIAPPLQGPDETELRRRLLAVGLPEDGMEKLIDRATGAALAQPATVGWLYWGRTNHLVRDKLQVALDEGEGLQHQGELEFQGLRELGAFATIQEHFNTRAEPAGQAAHLALAQQVALGEIEPLGAHAPRFARLQQRLAAVGIQAALVGEQLRLCFAQPTGETLTLARPFPHPWLPEQSITVVAAFPAQAKGETAQQPIHLAYRELYDANRKLARLLTIHAPEPLLQQAQQQVAARLDDYCTALLTRADLYFDSRVAFSGRTVLAPGPELHYDQIGLAEEMAWALFGPQLTRELGDANAVAQRTPVAAQQLDALMARSWLILNHSPTFTVTNMIAFHPVREPGKVIRLPPLACRILDTDFDGDQAAVFLPLTTAGQAEAGRNLSLAGHLNRDPGLLQTLAPTYEAMWGLAQLSRQAQGYAEIEALLGVPGPVSESFGAVSFVTRPKLIEALAKIFAKQGAASTLTLIEQLGRRGWTVAQTSGLSLSAFVDPAWTLPPAPTNRKPTHWQIYYEQVLEQLLACADLDHGIGPYVLGVKCGALPVGTIQTLAQGLGVRHVITDLDGQTIAPLDGYRQGLCIESFWQLIPGAREGLLRAWEPFAQALNDPYHERDAKSFHVLARARRARHPGLVFARAAAIGEVDPLVDEESRLFVGLERANSV